MEAVFVGAFSPLVAEVALEDSCHQPRSSAEGVAANQERGFSAGAGKRGRVRWGMDLRVRGGRWLQRGFDEAGRRSVASTVRELPASQPPSRHVEVRATASCGGILLGHRAVRAGTAPRKPASFDHEQGPQPASHRRYMGFLAGSGSPG